MLIDSDSKTCVVVGYLETALLELNVQDRGLAGIASNALAMIRDMNQQNISPIDLECLHELLSTVDKESSLSLSDTLSRAAPDCPICLALQQLSDQFQLADAASS